MVNKITYLHDYEELIVQKIVGTIICHTFVKLVAFVRALRQPSRLYGREFFFGSKKTGFSGTSF